MMGPPPDDGPTTPDPTDPLEPHRPSAPPETACPELRSAGPMVTIEFDHFSSGRFGMARHALHEPVVQRGEAFTLSARFRYGLASDDLEDEFVTAFVRLERCGEWTEIGTHRTDDEGMLDLDMDPSLFTRHGAYDVEIVVLGDLTRARGQIHVVPDGQPAVVFDIDGTLTTSDGELLSELYDGIPAEMYVGAPDVAWLYADAGYLIIYISGRPHMLQELSRQWLERHDFPIGPVITSDHLLETTGPLVRTHKREHLVDLMGRAGLVFPYAYGNATTDICAYGDAGIDPAATYIIGEFGGTGCDDYEATVAVESYDVHMTTLSEVPAAWD